MHRVDVRVERTEHVAVPASFVFLGEQRFQLLHKGAQKRTGPGKEGPGDISNLSPGQLIEILLADRYGYPDDTLACEEIYIAGDNRDELSVPYNNFLYK
jgi:hypothetical protein